MNFWGFVSAAVLLTLMPGPDILFVITQSITRGRKSGIVFASGLCTGLIFHVAAVSLGVSVILYQSPIAFAVLKFVGAAYLIYLGVKAFLRRREASLRFDTASSGIQKLYRKGILMNLLNPKVILFFLAFFPQFVNTNAVNPVLQMCVLGAVFMIQAFIVFSLVAVLADKLSVRLMQNQKAAYLINIAEAVIYCGIGISIAFM